VLSYSSVSRVDRLDFFKNPVNKNEVPDYFDLILNPMCWTMIEERLDKHEYWDVKSFRVRVVCLEAEGQLTLYQDDIELVINNALLYNAPGTPYHTMALRIRKHAEPILANLEKLSLPSHAIPAPALPSSLPPIGDLEAPLDILELLQSTEVFQDGLNLELDDDALGSLVKTASAKYKPQPPPSPILVPEETATSAAAKTSSSKKGHKKHGEKKRDRKAEAERSRARKAEARAAKAAAEAAAAAAATQSGEAGEPPEEHVDGEAAQIALDSQEPHVPAAPGVNEDSGSAPVLPVESHVPVAASGPGPFTTHKKKRATAASPAITTPLVVEDVGNQDSFHLFNSGWILPPEQKRGGRVAVEKAPLAPPKKRQKTEHGPSRLSISTVPEGDGQTRRVSGTKGADGSVVEAQDTSATSGHASVQSGARGAEGTGAGGNAGVGGVQTSEPERVWKVSLGLGNDGESESELSELSELPSEGPMEGVQDKDDEESDQDGGDEDNVQVEVKRPGKSRRGRQRKTGKELLNYEPLTLGTS